MPPEEVNRKFRRAFWSNAREMLELLGTKPENITELELITRKVVTELTAPGEPLLNGYPPDFEFPPAERDVPLVDYANELVMAPRKASRLWPRCAQGHALELNGAGASQPCPACEMREAEAAEREGRTVLVFADEEAEKQAAERERAREEETERLKAEETERLIESTPKL